MDLCDLEGGTARLGATAQGRVGDDWAIITRFSRPAPDRFDRALTTFVRGADGGYRREDEHHRNVLIDASSVPALLREHGVTPMIGSLFDDDARPLPVGLRRVSGCMRWKAGRLKPAMPMLKVTPGGRSWAVK